ncbi:protocadherin Fat 4-like [Pomacea canaliculata]|uniref:protocadherin Fat 4-like n=1 Tax=Pomacea canaliculata TaxID=400727 RepID=UPI000D73E0FA|nr:protocadherin Fat 4-like [Pomacea canaliculata]
MNIVVFIIAVLCSPVFSQYGCFLNYSTAVYTVDIPETIKAGDVLLTVFTTDNITIEDAGFNLIMPFFIELQLVSLQQGEHVYNVISKTSVTELDYNTTLCHMSRYWAFNLVCLSSPSNEVYIMFAVNYTDDYDPVWTQNLTLSAPELAPINTSITILSQIEGLYTDQDCASPNSRSPFYSIQGGNTDATFRMQSTSGEIVVNRLISYQKGETKFQLTVSITTYSPWDSPGRHSSAPVVINIHDIDDNDPVFDNPQYTVHVQEENSTVLNDPLFTSPPVFAFDQDTGINDSVTYSINGITDTVGIHNETGQVWVTRVMDREVEPFANVNIKANQVHNSWRSSVASVLVVVDDINDNRPKFSINNPTLVTIPEHSAFGSSVVRVLALDADEGDNALFNYTLKSHQNVFNIQTDILGSPRYGIVTVVNSSALDRETISSLTLTVYTEEFTPQQGGDCSTGMCNITITIQLTDINDNSPVFDNSSYRLTVRNNIKGVFLVAVNASDADEGENADLRYRCLPSYALGSDGCSVITVEDKTGEISLSQPVDNLQVYYASIEACDSPTDVSQMRCTTVPVMISLNPDLQLNVTSYNFTVYENLPAGTYVGDILNYNNQFELQDKNFELNGRTLRTKKFLDREEQDWYTFAINTRNENNTNISVLVTVLDVNDNSPVFNNTNYKLTVVNNIKDVLVETIRASDADEGENAHLSYKCVSVADMDGCGEITVNSTTGDIRLRQPLTKSQMYFALVEACDNHVDVSQSRCTSVPIRISLPPDFDLNVTSYNFTVHENLPAGTYVGDLLDYDSHFELHHDKFQLDEGTIRTKVSLDREAQDQYMSVINTHNQNNTNISVLVTVLDVNDNSPVFDRSNYRLTVVDNTRDALVHKVNASDADEGENARLQYRCMPSYVSSSNGCSVFTVNNSTGEIRLQQELTSLEMYLVLVEACDTPTDTSQSRCTTVPVRISLLLDFDLSVTSYNFTVHENLPAGTYVGDILYYDPHFELQDDTFELNERNLQTLKSLDREMQDQHKFVINTNDQNNTNISVVVTVLDVNDNSPVFNKSNYRLIVVDNNENTFLETINASDADEGENAVLRYRCVSSVTSNDACDVMTVNDTTGETRLLQSLVSSHTYYALVEACDSLTDISQRRCTTVPVSLHLPSAFNVTSYNFTVHENLPAGTYVGDILNHDDHFVLQHDKFELHDGTLRTKKPLDREDQDHHTLVVNTNNQNNTNISVLVIVLDVNDNNPVFKPNDGSVTLSGEETTGHVITVVNASDDDEGVNAEMTYSLQPDSMLQYFYINESGAVILQTLSTLETMDLLVKASDGGSPSLSGFYTLRITIPAVNRNVVIFAPVTSDKLAGERKIIESELMRILGANVTVETVRQHSADSSAIYITARGMSTGQPLKVEELQKLVDSKPVEIADLFRQNFPDDTSKTTAADDFTTPVTIVLILISAVLLVVLIIAAVVMSRSHKACC